MANEIARISALEIEVRRLIQRRMPRQIGELPPVVAGGDHGTLAGLADDDHPQYHNDARGDARYDPLGEAAAAVAAHAGAADPHPTYLTAAEGAAAFDALGSAAAAQAASQPLDSDLTAIAALATTAFGRALLTLADAAAFTATGNVATALLNGLAPASGGGTTNFLRADLTWAAPPGGSGGGNLDDILALEALL